MNHRMTTVALSLVTLACILGMWSESRTKSKIIETQRQIIELQRETIEIQKRTIEEGNARLDRIYEATR